MATTLPRHVQRRHRRLYAVLRVPSDLRESYGKQLLVKSLGTEDPREAEHLAMAQVAAWKRDFVDVRKGKSERLDPLQEEARQWAKDIAEANDEDRDQIMDVLVHRIEMLIEQRSREMGTSPARFSLDNPDASFTDLPGAQDKAVQDFAAVATGRRTDYLDRLEDYLAAPTTNMTAKSADEARKDIQKFAEAVLYLEEVNHRAVQQWGEGLLADGLAHATIKKKLSYNRNYWRWLAKEEVVSRDEANPFNDVDLGARKNGGSRGPKRGERAFEAEDVVKLLDAAKAKKTDKHLADLITLGMWTGCRRGELCDLKVEQVKLGGTVPYFEVEDAKTPAGWRQVPIHSELLPTMRRLMKASKDGYVLSGLTEDSYGDRGDVIGKRFSYLKTKLGFDSRYTFHSVRKTVITLLANAGVEPVLYKEIVGHETDDVTHKSYYAGATLARKRKAIEKLEYPSVSRPPSPSL